MSLQVRSQLAKDREGAMTLKERLLAVGARLAKQKPRRSGANKDGARASHKQGSAPLLPVLTVVQNQEDRPTVEERHQQPDDLIYNQEAVAAHHAIGKLSA